MRIVRSFWVEESDTQLIGEVREYGIRNVAREIGSTAGHISRWLKRKNGISEELFSALTRLLSTKQEA